MQDVFKAVTKTAIEVEKDHTHTHILWTGLNSLIMHV